MIRSTDRPALEDPRVLALAKARQQISHEGVFNPTWDELTPEEQEGALPYAWNYLHAAIRAGLTSNDTAAKDSPRAASTLSSDVLDLLAAIRDMANVPLPGLADVDERAWQNLMSRRLSELHAVLDVALSPQWTDTLDPANDAAHLRKRLAEMPVTYALYEPDGARQGDEAPVPAHEDEPEPDNPPRRAAREIQALHDPVVIGYVICVAALRLTLRPTLWTQWQDWQKRLGVKPGTATYRGGIATAEGKWGDVPVAVTCHLDRVPKSPAVENPAAHPATGRVPGLCPPCKRGDCDECMAVDHWDLPRLYTCHYVPNPHQACPRRGAR